MITPTLIPTSLTEGIKTPECKRTDTNLDRQDPEIQVRK